MKYEKIVKNGETSKNSFVITCVFSLFFLLTLCYFGIDSSIKGTSAADDGQQYYCNPGYYPSENASGDVICVDCLMGMYCPGGWNEQFNGFYECPSGTTTSGFNATSKEQCVSVKVVHCLTGEYLNGQGYCSNCPENHYCPGGYFSYTGGSSVNNGLYQCDKNSVSPAGSYKPEDCVVKYATCKAGEFHNTKGTCVRCSIGAYCPGGEKLEPNTIYESCPFGTTTDGYGAKSKEDCVVICTNGTYYSGNMDCLSCPAGSYCPAASHRVFVDAKAGDGIISCPAGTTSAKGSMKSSDCYSTSSGGNDGGGGSTTPVTKYTVTYKANGGNVDVTTVSVESGKTTTLPTATRSGYSFDGWYTAASGGTKVGVANASYTVKSNITLYAHWTQVSGGENTNPSTQTFTATFKENNGTLNGKSTISCSTESSSCIISPLPTATRDGYTFKGWGTSTSCTSGNTSSVTLTRNTTYYACYVKDNTSSSTPEVSTKTTLTAIFDENEGNLEGSSFLSCSTTGDSCVINTGLPTATRSGYTFKGWGTSASCTSGNIDSITLTDDTIYYACYVQNTSGGTSNKEENVADEYGNVTENKQTGEIAIALTWFIGLIAIGYSVYYFRSIKES